MYIDNVRHKNRNVVSGNDLDVVSNNLNKNK